MTLQRRYTAPLCPTTPEHGPLLDWPTGRYGFFCSHQGHDGRHGTPPSRAFFTTAEATGAPRSGQQSASPIPTPGREVAARTEAPVGTGSASLGLL